jgi:4-carboxymuconolactone decarboxylase
MADDRETDRPRLPALLPAQLDTAQRALYDVITGGARSRGPQAFSLTDDAGGLAGPFNAMLLSPGIGGALQELGSALRYRSALTDRCREIAILAVAAHWDSEFERHAHEAVGRTVGLDEDELTALRDPDEEPFTDPVERTVLAVTRALVRRHDLTAPEYARAVELLGEPLLFELVTLVGYYATLALQLRVFRVATPG